MGETPAKTSKVVAKKSVVLFPLVPNLLINIRSNRESDCREAASSFVMVTEFGRDRLLIHRLEICVPVMGGCLSAITFYLFLFTPFNFLMNNTAFPILACLPLLNVK